MTVETCVAGSILVDARCLPEVAAIVSEDDFTLEACRAVFHAALALDTQGKAVDPVTIQDFCEKAGTPVSNEFLVQCMDVTPTAANAGYHARILREASMRRALSRLGETVRSRVEDGEDPRKTLDYLHSAAEAIEGRDTAQDLTTTADAATRFYQYRNALDAGKTQGFVPTGLEALDKLLGGGFLRGGLYILGARPGMGKTTLALSILDAAQVPALFVSLEMGEREIMAKRIARQSGIPYGRVLMGQLSEDEYVRMGKAASVLSDGAVTINRRAGASVQDVGRMARKVKDLGLIAVDYLGLLRPDNPRASRYEQVTALSAGLKALARTRNVPVLALAQLNRENTLRKDRRPTLADLRDSGAVEQDADGVLLLHNEAYYDPDHPPDPATPAQLQCILAKHRHGPTGRTDLTVYFANGRVYPTVRRIGA